MGSIVQLRHRMSSVLAIVLLATALGCIVPLRDAVSLAGETVPGAAVHLHRPSPVVDAQPRPPVDGRPVFDRWTARSRTWVRDDGSRVTRFPTRCQRSR
jgi:hypothetical protein